MDARTIGGRFELQEVLGRGGMGTVWRAHDARLHRAVALKEIPLTGPDVNKVLREARLAARIDHPNAVSVYDAFVDGGAVYIVMELVPAPTLQDHVAQHGPLPAAQVADVGTQLIEVLGEAHRLGVVHRDVKPANVMLAERGGRLVPRLTDFGIARADTPGDTTATVSAYLAGSPAYMAPEQIKADAAPSSDLWSLAATLYFAAEGVAPFRRDTAGASIAAVLSDDPPAPVRAGAQLGGLLLAMLAKPVNHRPDPVTAAGALAALAGGAPAPAPVPPTVPVNPPPPTGTSQPPRPVRDGWLILAGVLGFAGILVWAVMFAGMVRGGQRLLISPVWLAGDSPLLDGLVRFRDVRDIGTPGDMVWLIFGVPAYVMVALLVYGVLLMTKARGRIRATDVAGMTAWWATTAYSAAALALTADESDGWKNPMTVLMTWAIPAVVSVLALARVIRHEWAAAAVFRQRVWFTAVAALCGAALFVVNLRLTEAEPVGVVVFALVYIGVPVVATLLRTRRAAFLLLVNWALACAIKLVIDTVVLDHLHAYGYGLPTDSGVEEIAVAASVSGPVGFTACVITVVLAIALNARLRRTAAPALA